MSKENSRNGLKALLLACLALGIHVALFSVRVDWKLPPEKTPAPISLEKFIEPKADEERPIVETSEALEQKETDAPARFLGEFRNRVEKETRSDRTGKFQERRRFESSLPGLDGEGYAPPGPWGIPAQSPHQLAEDLAKGNQTLLNTDPVIYASYINRIGDELYDVWTSLLYDAVRDLSFRGVRLDEKSYLTEIGLMLNRQGEVTGVQIVKSCGIPEFDNAAKDAFWKTEPFQNPPSQLFKSGNETAMLGFGFSNDLTVRRVIVLPQSL